MEGAEGRARRPVRPFVRRAADPQLHQGPGGARVARVLTAGSPYWGSPKSIFPLAFGIETPLLVGDGRADQQRRECSSLRGNLAGLYHLYPSDNFGPGCPSTARSQDQAGVQNFVNGARRQLRPARAAFDNHNNADRRLLRPRGVDRLPRRWRAAGVPTITASSCSATGDGDLVVDGRAIHNGDSTVPVRSAAQSASDGGPVDGRPRRACSTRATSAHVPLPGRRQGAGRLQGVPRHRAPAKHPEPRSTTGGVLRLQLGDDRPGRASTSPGASGASTRVSRARRASMSLDEAPPGRAWSTSSTPRRRPGGARRGRARRPDQVRDLRRDLYLHGDHGRRHPGRQGRYGPATGTLRIVPGAPGEQLRRSRSTALRCRDSRSEPTPTPTPDPGPVGGAAPPPGGSPPGAAPPSTADPPHAVLLPPQAGAQGSPPAHPGPPAGGSGRLRASVTRGNRKLGRLDVRIKAAGDRTFTIKLKSRPRGSLISPSASAARCSGRSCAHGPERVDARPDRRCEASAARRSVGAVHPDRSALRIPRPILLRLRRRLV